LEKNVDGFLSGKTCGIADFYFYVLMNWDNNKIDELAKRPNLEKIFNQVNETASVQKVLKNQTS
jgi:glutathione S-transferase